MFRSRTGNESANDSHGRALMWSVFAAVGRVKREARVALRTFGAAWLVTSAALLIWGFAQSPHPRGARDWLLGLILGSVLCAINTFWLACLIALARLVFRVLGAGAYLGALLVVFGITATLWSSRHVLESLLSDVLAGVGTVGPCGVHAGGAATILSLACMGAAILSSRASCWALLKLCLALGAAVATGALPGSAVWLLLLLRWARRLAGQNAERSNRSTL